jgi:hypothetical protein
MVTNVFRTSMQSSLRISEWNAENQVDFLQGIVLKKVIDE